MLKSCIAILLSFILYANPTEAGVSIQLNEGEVPVESFEEVREVTLSRAASLAVKRVAEETQSFNPKTFFFSGLAVASKPTVRSVRWHQWIMKWVI